MARFTQYIGLSPSAQEFLSNNKHKQIGSWKMTQGIAYEDIMGAIYEVNVKNDDPMMFIPDVRTYAEIEDICPWSSGPMIHTCLRDLNTGEKCFAWKENEIHYI